MANPVLIDLTKDVWTKVADSVTSGFIHTIRKNPNVYLTTYRDAGDPAPTDKSDAVKLYPPGEPISSSVPIDVYVQPVGEDGRVRVDL